MKSETEATYSWSNSIATRITATALLTSFFVMPNHFVPSKNLLSHRLTEETTSSQPKQLRLPEINRVNLIRSIRGKYSFVQTSSDEFAKRKLMEINVEG